MLCGIISLISEKTCDVSRDVINDMLVILNLLEGVYAQKKFQ